MNKNQALIDDLSATSTAEDFLSVRGHGFAGAGISLAFILLLAQLATPAFPHLAPYLLRSLILSAISLPIWLFFALTYDMWVALKLTPADMHMAHWRSKSLTAMAITAGLLNLGTIWCLLMHFSALAAGLFVMVTLSGLIYLLAMLVAATKIRIRKFQQQKAVK